MLSTDLPLIALARLQPLSAILHARVDADTRATLNQIFSDGMFVRRDGLSYEAQCALTYERLRHLSDRIPPGTSILQQPAWLFGLAQWTAVNNPSLFMAFSVHFGLALACVVRFGEAPALSSHVRELESLSAYGSLMGTELGRGTSQVAMGTTAAYDATRDEFVLSTPDSASQKFMPATGLHGVAKLGVVFARLLEAGEERGLFPFVVPLRDSQACFTGVGIRSIPGPTPLPLDYAVTGFHEVRIPYSNWLNDGCVLASRKRESGSARFFHDVCETREQRLARTLSITQNMWAMAPAALAACARASVGVALDYAYRRVTSGRLAPGATAIRYRDLQRSLFGALATTYAMTCAANRTIEDWISAHLRPSSTPDDRRREAAPPQEAAGFPIESDGKISPLSKVTLVRFADEVITACRLSSGAQGFLGVNRFVEYQGLAQGLTVAGGDNSLLVAELARSMLAATADEGACARSDDLDLGLEHPAVWTSLLRCRYATIRSRLQGESSRLKNQGLSEFEVANAVGELTASMVDAAGELHLAQCFAQAWQDSASQVQELLAPLLTVFGAKEILRHADWYCLHELIGATHLDRLRSARDNALDSLLSTAPLLTAAFDLEDAVVQAPIAGDYVSHFCAMESRSDR